MKQILIELDDRSARDLERVAPAKKRLRAEFVRRAIRRAIDLELDRNTEAAYRELPLPGALEPGDLLGWDTENELAERRLPVRAPRAQKRRKRAA
ncbi:MAG: hypothetical protein IT377_06500 [Polyangiaceae bacterium]|nr:hypothetical protein [Polyangiaceae bacterium]